MSELVEDGVVAASRAMTFEDLVAASADRMLRTAVLLTGDRPAAEDLVQSTYAQVFARWRLVSRADNPTAYTRTILVRLFLSDRRRKRVRELPLEAGADVGTTPADPDLRLALVEALATLRPTDRAVLVLRYFHDLPVAAVAAHLGLSEAACRTRASRALARLRVRFPELSES